jgi:hypothetical protein
MLKRERDEFCNNLPLFIFVQTLCYIANLSYHHGIFYFLKPYTPPPPVLLKKKKKPIYSLYDHFHIPSFATSEDYSRLNYRN